MRDRGKEGEQVAAIQGVEELHSDITSTLLSSRYLQEIEEDGYGGPATIPPTAVNTSWEIYTSREIYFEMHWWQHPPESVCVLLTAYDGTVPAACS